MMQKNIVALYTTHAVADDARDNLRAAGIPDSDISLGEGESTQVAPKQEEGFWGWLLGSEVSEAERDRYAGHLRDGRIAVSVRAHSDVDCDKIIAVLERFDPIDIDGGEAGEVSSPARTGSAGFAAAEARAATRQSGDDQVIPLAREELEVGKRQVERRFRVRTHVTEQPVEQEVHLRDERVVIERRPASNAAAVGAAGLQDRELEVIERREEPVVTKRVDAKEEVVIRKDTSERVETVRDTVRETKIAVDREAAGGKPSLPQSHRDQSLD